MRYADLYRGPMDTGIEGSFGYRAPYACAYCGPISRVEVIQTYRATFDSPAEFEWACPLCGSIATGENDDPKPPKLIRRWRLRLARIVNH
jgi:rubrerythrin